MLQGQYIFGSHNLNELSLTIDGIVSGRVCYQWGSMIVILPELGSLLPMTILVFVTGPSSVTAARFARKYECRYMGNLEEGRR